MASHTEHSAILRTRQARGRSAYLSGAAAEERVTRAYRERGCSVLAQRWRGKAGEIDLIVRRGDLVVFVEVKSSRSFERAIESLSMAQLSRIQSAALEYLAAYPDLVHLALRFDLAVVEGTGRFRVLPNITM